jgi:hypothetical protein
MKRKSVLHPLSFDGRQILGVAIPQASSAMPAEWVFRNPSDRYRAPEFGGWPPRFPARAILRILVTIANAGSHVMLKPVPVCLALVAMLAAPPAAAGTGDDGGLNAAWQPQAGQAGFQMDRRQGDRGQSPAASFGYSYLDLLVGSQEHHDLDEDGDTRRLDLSVGGEGAAYLYLGWQRTDFDEFGDAELREFGLGFQEQYTAQTSFYVLLSYGQERWDDENLGADGSFYRGRYGFRTRPWDRVEFEGAVVYTRGRDNAQESSWSGDLGLSIYLADNFALRAMARDLDGAHPSLFAGIRLGFGD